MNRWRRVDQEPPTGRLLAVACHCEHSRGKVITTEVSVFACGVFLAINSGRLTDRDLRPYAWKLHDLPSPPRPGRFK